MNLQSDIFEIPEHKTGMYDWYFILTILLLSAFFAFWKLGSTPLEDWDESRHGVNALEMIQKNDFINYYYANDQLDMWNAKPPLMMWSIVACYKLFGYNTFSLRLPTAISVLVFFIFAYRLIRLYREPVFAFLVCIALMSCKAVFSWHVGRTGDCDAMLVTFLTISVYYTLLYVDFEKRYAILLAGIFLGVAFYSKGVPAFFLLPGLALYIILKEKLIIVLKDPLLYLSGLLFLIISGSWFFLLGKYGAIFDLQHSYAGSENAWQTMLFYDTIQRFSSDNFDPTGDKRDLAYFFTTNYNRLNGWRFPFYLTTLYGLYLLYLHRKSLKPFLQSDANRLTLLSACLVFSLGIILTIARNQHDWYLAPVFLFIMIIVFIGFFAFYKRYKKTSYLIVVILFLSLGRQFMWINKYTPVNLDFISQNKEALTNCDRIYMVNPSQSMYLYMKWVNPNVYMTDAENPEINTNGQKIILVKKASDYEASHAWTIKTL